jgi:hypothetical protein
VAANDSQLARLAHGRFEYFHTAPRTATAARIKRASAVRRASGEWQPVARSGP